MVGMTILVLVLVTLLPVFFWLGRKMEQEAQQRADREELDFYLGPPDEYY